MPISEDEFEISGQDHQDPMSTMSKAELRKTHKPIMEKKRRARINQSLNEIKSLILDALNKDPARHSKLEKADILEMAVKHLQNVQKQQLALAMAADPTVLQKFKSGFSECSDEVLTYIDKLEVDGGMKQRIQSHLTKCITSVEQMAQIAVPTITYPFLSGPNGLFADNVGGNCDGPNAGDLNNNPRIQIPQGIQLIPSRLPSGEIAFLLPNSSNLPYFSSLAASTSKGGSNNIQQQQRPNRPSAFAAVIPSSATTNLKLLSPPLSPVHSISSLNDDSSNQSLINQQNARTPSPHGFRPVNPGQSRNILIPPVNNNNNNELPKSTPMVHGSDIGLIKTEVKTIRYPISNNLDRKYGSPRKPGDPLCIITNHAERFKQAHTLEDSAQYEENKPKQGLKRALPPEDGLLAIANHDDNPPKRYFRTFRNQTSPIIMPSTSSNVNSNNFPNEGSNKSINVDYCSRDNESSNDMWRPW